MTLGGSQGFSAVYLGGTNSRCLQPKIKPRIAQPTAWSLHQLRRPPPFEVWQCNKRRYKTCQWNVWQCLQRNCYRSKVIPGHESFSHTNETHGLESYMSSWPFHFFFFLRYSFIVSFIYVCVFCFFFFSFSFRYRFFWLSILCVQFPSPAPPFRRVSCWSSQRLMSLIAQSVQRPGHGMDDRKSRVRFLMRPEILLFATTSGRLLTDTEQLTWCKGVGTSSFTCALLEDLLPTLSDTCVRFSCLICARLITLAFQVWWWNSSPFPQDFPLMRFIAFSRMPFGWIFLRFVAKTCQLFVF